MTRADRWAGMRSRMWSRLGMAALVATTIGVAPPVDARSRGGTDDGAALPPSASSAAIPESLQSWSRWVLQDHERKLCPSLAGDDDGDGTCLWAGRLAVALDQRGGKFSQEVEVLAPSAVPLPGGRRTWPLDVKVDGKPAVVIAAGAGDDVAPVVRLGVGRHTLSGTFSWRALPESLPIPASTGLVALALHGRAVAFPSRSDAGTLFLQREEREVAEEEKLDIAVHRHLSDEIPALLTTRLVLNVSGKAREVVLGRALPAAFVAHALESPLPARIEPDGRLRVQLRPGTWTVVVVARHEAALTKVARPVPDGPWKEGDEVWVFAAHPELRVVTVEGVAAIDPQQTTLPAEWKGLPAYLMTAGATMSLNQRRRGDDDPAPDQLQLRRHLWLDFDGAGLTAQDRISGTFQRGWRLSMGPESKLGRVSVNGQDQFITRVGAGPEGVEIRQTRAALAAESRLNRTRGGIPAVGWDQDFQSVSATLALPPGWMLAHASGADTVATTWIQLWSLLDLFLLLVTGLGMAKVFGWRTGALALVTLGLVLPQPEAPQWIWLIALVAETLVRALPAGRLRSVAIGGRLVAWVVLLIAALPFAVNEVRVALHPALGPQGGGSVEYDDDGEFQALTRPRGKEGHQDRAEAPEAPEDPAAQAKALGLLGQNKSDISDVLGGMPGVGVGSLGVTGTGGLRARSRAAAPPATQNLAAYDPNVMVQTGPGVPKWTWGTVHLGWNGPVEKTQRLNLWLVPPAANLVLGLGRVALMALLIVHLFGGRKGLAAGLRLGRSGGPPRGAATAAAIVLALSLALTATSARAAEFPDDELLDKLRERLLKKPACHPDCAAFGRLTLDAVPDRLRLRLEAGAAATAAVPLPGSAEQWIPETVTVDGKPALLVRDDKGVVWTLLDAGSHQVVLEGALPSRETVQIPFVLVPRAVTVTAKGWKVEGLSEGGVIEGSLQLSREAASPSAPRGVDKGGNDSALGSAAASLPPFVRVERTLNLGLKWEARTRVVRQTPPGAAAVLEVPLLPGESVVSSGVQVARGRVQLNLGAADTELTWNSTLAEAPQVVLQAPAAAAWAEVWLINVSPVWHVAFAGIPAIRPPGNTAARVPEWRPWPGEKVVVTVSKPAGVVGQTLTIDEATLTVTPGIRSSSAALALSLRSSRGGEHTITLPEGATVDGVTVNGNKQPLRQEGRRLTLPINPGRGQATIAWRQPLGLSTVFRAPVVDLGLPAVNVNVTIDLARDRWILAVGGPRLGPAVLFWSFVVVLVLFAVGLGRTGLAPLGVRHWILLGLGLSQTPPPAAALVAGALLAFGWRRARPPARRPWVHNLGQLVFALWTIAAIAVLFAAIKQGLLEQPDMRITGNGSYGGHLNWFADRAGGVVPQPWVVSAPLLVYRLAMLAWALWLALAVLRWARWVWGCFTHGDLWRPSAKKPKAALAPASPSASTSPGPASSPPGAGSG